MGVTTENVPIDHLAHLAADTLAGSGCDETTCTLFLARLRRWWPDVCEALAEVYPAEELPGLHRRLVVLAARAEAGRAPDLRALDLRRMLAPDWFQEPNQIGYACYADRFAGDLAAVGTHIDYLRELGVTYLHLMPLLRPRPGDSDGGYAVADYRDVRPDLGTVADLRALTARLRHAGISPVLDLVLNHVAAEHDWAARARAGEQHYRDYFHIYPDRAIPDAFENTLPEVFPDFAPGNFTWDPDLDGWVWTTFNSFQWDLNWTNPDVFCEFADIVFFLANAGVEVIRLDAIAFLRKRMGTNCQNQPEVHAIAQALRGLARIVCPAVAFKAEAIVGPTDLVQYLGTGRHYGKVSDIAYHNALMVHVWSMLATGDVGLTAYALARLPSPPTSTAWVTYVRCHDDIGWAIDDGDAAAVGLDGAAHRSFLADYYSGDFPGSQASGLVFQYNPVTGDRRTSGMAASLAGLDRAETDADRARVTARLFLAYALVMGWGGIPVIWQGDEIALGNDRDWAREPGHDGDNRWVHRPRMDWVAAARRADPGTVAGATFAAVTNLVRARRELVHLHAGLQSRIGEVHDPGILPVIRDHPVGRMAGLYNVTDGWRGYPAGALGLGGYFDHISQAELRPDQDGVLWLGPYSAVWLTDAPAEAPAETPASSGTAASAPSPSADASG